MIVRKREKERIGFEEAVAKILPINAILFAKNELDIGSRVVLNLLDRIPSEITDNIHDGGIEGTLRYSPWTSRHCSDLMLLVTPSSLICKYRAEDFFIVPVVEPEHKFIQIRLQIL